MLLITCPWCGARDQSEFSYGGEAHIPRPANSEKLTEATRMPAPRAIDRSRRECTCRPIIRNRPADLMCSRI